MLTKNFYQLMTQMFRRRLSGNETISVTDVSGNVQTMEIFSSSQFPDTLLGALGTGCSQWYGEWFGAFFGTGKTPPTANDIAMEAPISVSNHDTSLFPLLVESPGTTGILVLVEDTYAIMAATYYVTNKMSNAVEISEIGLHGKYVNDTSCVPFMLDHTVLDEPIVLQPGETVPISYEIKFPYGV